MKILTSKFENIKSHFFCLLLGFIVSACACNQPTQPEIINTVTNNISNTITNNIDAEDLRVRKEVVVSSDNLTLRQRITVTATVENIGNDSTNSTTLHWYLSLDSTINSSDTEIGTNTVPVLAFEDLMSTNITVTVPDRDGVYYYGACVDSVIGEVNTNNNCSLGSRILVSRPDLSVVSTSVRNSRLDTINWASLSITIENIGYSSLDYTSLFWYLSLDPSISSSDTAIGRAPLPNFDSGEIKRENISVPVPDTIGVYYFGGCVLPIMDETNTVNNCSSGVRVEVGYPYNFSQAPGNRWSTGIWSDGATMWICDSSTDKIYAYDMLSKARVPIKDFNTLSNAGNNGPASIWSDGVTMWVSDLRDDKIYAYNLLTKARDTSKDFNTLADSNHSPVGIWSDGVTMWVSEPSVSPNRGDAKLYAYNVLTKARDTNKDFNNLSPGYFLASDIWSDGTTMWVADLNSYILHAYNLLTKARDTSKEFGIQAGFGIWSDGTTLWMSDYTRMYRQNISGFVSLPLNPDLTVNDVTVNDTVQSNGQNITLTTTVINVVAASPSTFLRIYGSTDSIIDYSDLELGSNAIPNLSVGGSEIETVTVTAPNHFGTYYYGVCVDVVDGEYFTGNNCSIGKKVTISPTGTPTGDFDTLSYSGIINNIIGNGIWSDGTTAWVLSREYGIVYAYNLSNKARNSSKDIDAITTANTLGIWADERTMWVGDNSYNKLFAYDLKTSERDETKDIFLQGENTYIAGVCSDDFTIWINGSHKLFAYNKMTKERDSSKDINIDSTTPGHRHAGIWTDGATMWVAYWNVNSYNHTMSGNRIDAYNLTTKQRDSSKDIILDVENYFPTDIWSDGTTMWVTDYWDDRIYAYSLATKQRVP